jgi:hypothetical protein
MGYGVSTPRPRAEGEAFAIMESDAAPDPHETVRRALRTLAPNRPKRGDLDYASPALDARVPLDGEAKTVSDLVRRVAEATRLEVYADRRVGGLPVTVLAAPGQTARAGDLLKALAYAVTGTFRAVEGGDAGGEGPKVYLLTDDIEGIAPRRLRQIQWHADADSLTAAEQARIEEEIRQKNIAPLIGFAPDDPGALPPALVGRVEKALAENGREAAVSAADLPLPLREMVQQQIVEHARALPEAPLRPDRVYLNLNLTAQILLPGVGEFDGPPLGRLSSLLSRPANTPGAAGSAAQPEAGSTAPAGGASSAPAALPAPFAARSALLVAPTNPDEARAAVAAGRSRGIARVFVAVPFGAGASGEQTARALLGAAIEAGKKEGVPVWAAVRLLRRPAAGTGNGSDSAELLPRDRNVFGETPAGFAARRGDAPDSKRVAYWGEEIAARGRWDWLCLEDEKTRAVLADELARLAAVPGLAGLVLRDVAAPGRALPPDATPGTPLLGTYLGYTPQTRVEMIRRENVDPVDLLPSNGMGGEYEESLLPFFPEERPGAASPGPRQVRDPRTGEWRSEPPAPGETLWARWGALRRDENRRHLALLGAQLKTRLPAGIPLMLGLPNPDGALFASGYALWESPEQPPRAEDRPKPGAAGERLVPVVATDRSEPGTFARNGIAALPERAAQYNGGGWNGVVLDLSALPVTKALNLLRGAMAPAALPAQR